MTPEQLASLKEQILKMEEEKEEACDCEEAEEAVSQEEASEEEPEKEPEKESEEDHSAEE